MSYRLERRVHLPAPLDDVFAFFKNPLNLGVLTPPWLGFRILDTTDREVRVGTEISYRLTLHGIPLKWKSRITEYREGELFADEQLSGPYRRWYHRHRFASVAGGVEMIDVVEYELPFGILGRIAHALFVKRQLRTIFDFRTEVIRQRFPAATTGDTSAIGANG
ncbi:MAG: SRPBCC family protein [Gemmatimonadota bacterium]